VLVDPDKDWKVILMAVLQCVSWTVRQTLRIQEGNAVGRPSNLVESPLEAAVSRRMRLVIELSTVVVVVAGTLGGVDMGM